VVSSLPLSCPTTASRSDRYPLLLISNIHMNEILYAASGQVQVEQYEGLLQRNGFFAIRTRTTYVRLIHRSTSLTETGCA
jgi:hypothetical protein